jgi:hypothetical protein
MEHTLESAMAELSDTLTLSVLIARLESILDEQGDIPVFIADADTGWALPIEKFEIDEEIHPEGKKLMLGGSY